jgi:hypothetical protein
MERFHLATSDEEDDLYSGFNEFHPTLNTANVIQDSLAKDVRSQQNMIQVLFLTYPYANPVILLKNCYRAQPGILQLLLKW